MCSDQVGDDGEAASEPRSSRAGIDQDPMHNDVGIDKLSQSGTPVRAGLAGNSDDHMRGPGEVDQLIEAVDGTQAPERDRSGNGGRDGGSGVASSRIGHDPRRQTRRSAGRSMGSGPDGVSSAEHPGEPRPAERGSGATLKTEVNGIDLIMSRGLFMNRHRSLGLHLEDEATAEPSIGSAPTFSIPGLTILGSPRTIRFSFKLFDRPNRR